MNERVHVILFTLLGDSVAFHAHGSSTVVAYLEGARNSNRRERPVSSIIGFVRVTVDVCALGTFSWEFHKRV